MLLRLQELQMPEFDSALSLRPETAFSVLLKDREFDANAAPLDFDEGSNSANLVADNPRPVAAERGLAETRAASG
jgi:hypothetical protein